MIQNILRKHFDWVVTPRDRILSAVSEDGVTWAREPGVRIDVGGSNRIHMAYYQYVHCPEDMAGLWEMYFQAAIWDKGQWKNRILSASSENGLVWVQNADPVLSSGSSNLNYSQIRAPFLIDFGSFWRMYFSSRGKDGKFRILSGISVDRKTWKIEQEARLSPEQFPKGPSLVTGVSDCTIVQLPSGAYRMYFTVIRESEWFQEICSAISYDGKKWEVEAGVRIRNGKKGYCTIVNNPSVIQTQGGYQMYFRGGDLLPLWNNIYVAESRDGINWTVLGTSLTYKRWHRYERHAVAFPFVFRISEDKYRMYYTGYWGHLADSRIIKRYKKMGEQIEIAKC